MSELNQEVETNDQVPVEASSEEKFFGVKTKIVKKEKLAEKKDESDIELEVVDDRPVDDRRPAKSEESEACRI